MNRATFRGEYEAMNRKLEMKFLPPVTRAIHGKVKATIAHLHAGGYSAATRFLQDDMVNVGVANAVKKLYTAVGLAHARRNYSRLLHAKMYPHEMEAKTFGFNYEWTMYILNYLQKHYLDKIVLKIAETTREALMRTLKAGIAAGWSIDQMVSRLEDGSLERYQSARIVRTETNRAANVGAMAQYETSAYEMTKEWLSAGDFRVRGKKGDHASHIKLNGQRIDATDAFKDSVNGDILQFPGDPAASAASTINCRCQLLFVIKRDENGQPIRKRRSTTVIYPNNNKPPRVILPRKPRGIHVQLPGTIPNRQTILI